jgi:threonine dehydrogenase-like Zn-dependent dehydrogenase/glycosyltransferase involved in cell wall biosynthesis
MPETSIIIRTFNEQKHLPNLFKALARQSYQDFETIVVDSGSFDKTRDIAEEHADQLIRISSHDFTYGFSLNAGIRHAKGKFIVMTSAHTIPRDEHWLENIIAPFADDDVAMTYGKQLGIISSKFSEVEDLQRMFGDEPKIEDPSQFVVNNANSAIRRDLWEQYPFDEKLPGLEDIDWARHWMEKNHQVHYVPKASLYHIHEESWRQIRTRFYREAVARRHMGLIKRRNLPVLLLAEARDTIIDFGHALSTDNNPVADRLNVYQRLREIFYYRLNKNAGLLRGTLSAHPLETRQEQEDVLFNRSTVAVVIDGPGKAELKNVEIPEIKPGDALIRVSHVAVCATDLEIFNGTLGYYKNGMAQYPIVPGHEFSGRIAAVGQNVKNLKEDDSVVVECIQSCGTCSQCQSGNFIGCQERTELGVFRRNGAYADYVAVPARFVHKVPQGMDLKRAALTEPTAVILKGLRRLEPALAASGKTNGKQRCAVIGSGPLGHLCSLILTHRGCEVTAFDRNPKRRALFENTAIKTSNNLEELSNFNVIVEITGDPEVLNKALHQSAANACLLLLGLPYGQREFSFEAIAAYDKMVMGSVGSTAEDFKEALNLLPNLELNSYFQCILPLDEFSKGWEMSKTGDVLKVMLDTGADRS